MKEKTKINAVTANSALIAFLMPIIGDKPYGKGAVLTIVFSKTIYNLYLAKIFLSMPCHSSVR
jgi:hypothetical protein